MKNTIIVLLVLFLNVSAGYCEMSHIIFKDGRTYDGKITKQNDKQVFLEGCPFNREDIRSIEKIKEPPVQFNWIDYIILKTGFITKKELKKYKIKIIKKRKIKALNKSREKEWKAYVARRDKNRKALLEMKEANKKEIQKAKRNQAVLKSKISKVKIAKVKKEQEIKRKKMSSKTSLTSVGFARNRAPSVRTVKAKRQKKKKKTQTCYYHEGVTYCYN